MARRPGWPSWTDSLADGALDDYPYLHAARADLLRRLGRWTESSVAYQRALTLTGNASERAFLERRIGEMARAKRRTDRRAADRRRVD